MKNLYKLNVGPIVVLIAIYYICYLLLESNGFHTSIASIINTTQNLPFEPHLLVVGLIPVYVACMVFGAGLLGIILGNKLQNYLLTQITKPKK